MLSLYIKISMALTTLIYSFSPKTLLICYNRPLNCLRLKIDFLVDR